MNHPSTVDDFGRTVVYRPENIERQEEKEGSGEEIKLKRDLVKFVKFRPIKGYGDYFRPITIFV